VEPWAEAELTYRYVRVNPSKGNGRRPWGRMCVTCTCVIVGAPMREKGATWETLLSRSARASERASARCGIQSRGGRRTRHEEARVSGITHSWRKDCEKEREKESGGAENDFRLYEPGFDWTDVNEGSVQTLSLPRWNVRELPINSARGHSRAYNVLPSPPSRPRRVVH